MKFSAHQSLRALGRKLKGRALGIDCCCIIQQQFTSARRVTGRMIDRNFKGYDLNSSSCRSKLTPVTLSTNLMIFEVGSKILEGGGGPSPLWKWSNFPLILGLFRTDLVPEMLAGDEDGGGHGLPLLREETMATEVASWERQTEQSTSLRQEGKFRRWNSCSNIYQMFQIGLGPLAKIMCLHWFDFFFQWVPQYLIPNLIPAGRQRSYAKV